MNLLEQSWGLPCVACPPVRRMTGVVIALQIPLSLFLVPRILKGTCETNFVQGFHAFFGKPSSTCPRNRQPPHHTPEDMLSVLGRGSLSDV